MARSRLLSVGALLLVLPAWQAAYGERDSTFDVQGHRGYAGRFPENSLPAFAAAIELGLTTLELDVRITRDRVLIVHHDERLDGARCRDARGAPVPRAPLHGLSYSALEGIDCRSSGSRAPAAPRARIPRLIEVLALVREARYPVRLSIELKPLPKAPGVGTAELTTMVVQAIREAGLERRTALQSFDPGVLRIARALAPEIDRAILVRRRRDYRRRVEQSGATILAPRHGALRREDVAEFHARGIAVVPWTVNRPESIRELLEWGVDGMISDYPERVLAALGRPASGAAEREPPSDR